MVTRFRPDQVRRYSRHVLLPDVGGTGQARLLDAAVVVDVDSAAGRIAAAYLVAAGVGTVYLDGARPVEAGDAWFPLAPHDVGARLDQAVAAALADRNPDVVIETGPGPHGCARLTVTGGDGGLASGFAEGGEAAARWLHATATRGRP